MQVSAQRTITAKPNHKAKTFTIRILYPNGAKTKYRTLAMNKADFQSSQHNTQNDWAQFLKSESYYLVN